MAYEIPDHFNLAFTTNTNLLLQQKNSKLENAVMKQHAQGEGAQVVKQFGEATYNEKASRHADTVWSAIAHKQRWIFPTDETLAIPVDKQDEVRMLDSPKSAYVAASVAAYNRLKDDFIIAAATGSAQTGKNGTTATPFDTANQQIAAGAAGLTLAKLITASEILNLNEVDEDETRYIAVGAKEVSHLLNDSTITSADYNSVLALMAGKIDSFMGFKFIMSNRLSLSGSTRSCLAWVESGLALGTWFDLEFDISKRPDKENTVQVFSQVTMGATRTEEGKVVEILCAE